MLKLKPNPTFKAKVSIHVPGDTPADVEFEFKHMTRDALDAYLKGPKAEKRSYEETAKSLVVGWSGVDEDYSGAAFDTMMQNYMGSAARIVTAYGEALTGAKLGN